jgi:hypothetical protein
VTVALPSRFATNVHRLALGVEPVDAARRLRVSHRLRFSLETTGAELPPVVRHSSCLYALLHAAGVDTPADVRIEDLTRRLVPRRLRIPFPALGAVEAAEQLDGDLPASQRTRRPFLFPGAAYDLAATATALRGRVLRGTAPMRWARVEARAGDTLIGRAHGDDRGEFLLVLGPDLRNLAELTSPLAVDVRVVGPTPPPAPPPVIADPLWDLPVETLPAAGNPDPISTGEQLPAAYVPGSAVTRTVLMELGRLTRAQPAFVVP